MSPRSRPLLAAAVVAMLAYGCGGEGARPQLREIPRPDLGGAEPAVRDQIEAARAEVERLLVAVGTEPGALAEAHARLGFVYLTYEFLEASEAVFENAALLEPGERRWVYLRGLLAKMQGHAERAVELLTLALEMEPGDPVTLVRLADARLELGDRGEARRLFAEALEIDADSAAAIEGLGRIAAAEGDTAGAVELFHRALELQPSASSLHYSLSQAYRRLGRLEEAQFHLARRGSAPVTVGDPLLAPVAELGRSVHLQLAQANRAMEDRRFDAAADSYRSVLELEPDDVAARHGLAVALLELGDVPAALEHLEDALRRVPAEGEQARLQRIDILGALAAVHLRQGNDDEAIESLDAVLALDADRLDVRSQRGDALARRGRLEEAIAEYDRILAAREDHPPTLLKRATAHLHAGRVEEGLRDFERAVAAAPREPAIRLRYAEALEHVGRRAEAARERAAAREGASGDEQRGHLLAEEGRRLVAAGRYQEAIRSFEQAIDLAPDPELVRLELGRVLGHVGRFREAEEQFSRVLSTSPRNLDAWRGRILAAVLDRRFDAAKVALRDALQVFPRDDALANALARLLATAAAPAVRDGDLALELAERVHRVRADSTSAETLAAALAEAGRFEEALALQRQIVDSAPAGTAGDLARARLDAYGRGEPWRLRSPEEIAELVSAPRG
ncbi:MAG TPA: tetratricopeptide repeat protein [Thermoanaerobaculia bacterium]|nr:tetratricopeptide repeat protein [Thermoanaerobaculia bacterium]